MYIIRMCIYAYIRACVMCMRVCMYARKTYVITYACMQACCYRYACVYAFLHIVYVYDGC